MSNQLITLEHNNQRILTTQQLADFYGTETRRISENYRANGDRYQEGTHHFLIASDNLKAFKDRYGNSVVDEKANCLYLWTEKGALLHAKSLNTDKAWEVYQTLVDTYFRKTQIQAHCVEDLIIMQAQSMKELRTEVKLLKETTQTIKDTTQTIKDTIITQPDNWREDINRMFNKIALTIGENKFRDLRGESYKLREDRAHVDLKRRLIFYQARLAEQGMSKTAVNKTNRLDVIEQDPKLMEIYAKIIQEYTIRFVA